MTKVLVSLVTHDHSSDVERLLPTLSAQTERALAIHALDNASEDGSRAALAAAQRVSPFPFTLVASRVNLGYAGGHNQAIAEAVRQGIPWVLVLNSDVLLAPDFVEKLLAAAEAPGHERVGSLAGKILRAEGENLTPTNVVDSVGLHMTRNGRHFDLGAGEQDAGQYDAPAEVFGVSGCAALYRTSALSDVRISTGYFDDDFFVYREDVDLAWRLRGRGHTALCVPSALAWHRRRNLPTGETPCPAREPHSVKNRFLLRLNNAGAAHVRATFVSTFVRDTLVVGSCLTLERSSLPALRWLGQHRRRLLEKRKEILARRPVGDAERLPGFTADHAGAPRPVKA
jgi:GT2 family glycosyltransferase